MVDARKKVVVMLVVVSCVCLAYNTAVFAEDTKSQAQGVEITPEEIAEAQVPQGDTNPDDFFTIGSTKDDVERIQGKPDEKYFDGTQMVWYYGKDAVYFDFYDKVTGVDNKSGNLKVD